MELSTVAAQMNKLEDLNYIHVNVHGIPDHIPT